MKSVLALATLVTSAWGALAAQPVLAAEAPRPAGSAASLAGAEFAPADEELVSPIKPFKPIRVGVQVELLPLGSIGHTPKYGEVETKHDTVSTFAVTARLDYDIAKHIRVGAAPRLILGVDSEDGMSTGKEVDLRARATGHGKIGDRLELHGFLSPGFATSVPDDPDVKKAQGFIFGVGAGANLVLSEAFYLSSEVAYQWGFQRQGGAYLTTDFLSFAVGAGTRF